MLIDAEPVVTDSSVVVAALLDSGADGAWAGGVLRSGGLTAPHLMPCEASNLIRRSVLRGAVSAAEAAQAHADLLDLPVTLFPFDTLAGRVWRLKDNVTAYDAWYVALAEGLSAPFATLRPTSRSRERSAMPIQTSGAEIFSMS